MITPADEGIRAAKQDAEEACKLIGPIFSAARHAEIFNDAGLFREYIALRYGQVLTYGGSSGQYFRACLLARRLANMTGKAIEDIIADIKEDYSQIEALDEQADS